MKLKILIFQDRLGILLEMRLSGVAEQEYAMLYGKSYFTCDASFLQGFLAVSNDFRISCVIPMCIIAQAV